MFNLFGKNHNSLKEIPQEEKKVIFASILIECAKEDGKISDIEKEKIKDILNKKFKLQYEEIIKLMEYGIELSETRVELFSLIRDIKNNFSPEEISNLFVSMWEIVLIDGVIDDFEAALMRKSVGLFNLTDFDSAEAKKIAQNNLKTTK
ncbi:MAG: hypothetical protein CMM91_03585 [Rickettsiales bacterium]|nr:hypothetical protein [Rickettsiales bacterium]OUV54137.1 MAG: hypothetical protein CBC87_02330 [Rickettsiales bacterium TMED127]|tara:strand:+ start:53904 stop:54350 length:447 start_codon:yes stop_codon:yes gene_type:complete